MRLFLIMLTTALTGIGGHFLNRRWDRALLFFGLTFLWGVGGSYLMSRYAFRSISLDTPEQFQEIFRFFYQVISAGIGVIWLISLVVAWHDARNDSGMILRWTIGGAIGAVLLTLLCGGYVIAQGLSFHRMTATPITTFSPEGEEGFDNVSIGADNFWQYLSFGGLDDYSRELPLPPEGSGILRGRFLYEGEPAAGVALMVTLNGQYRSGELVTDRDGYFNITVPPGEWFVNAIQTTRWDGKPAGKTFLLVSGCEDRLVGKNFERHNWFGKRGIKVVAGNEGVTSDSLILQIRETVHLVWPSGRGDDRASIAESAIEWVPYSGATDYLVEVVGLRREGNTTYYEEVARRRVSGENRLALSTFTSADGGDPEKEYLVRVFSFAPDGTFLAESENFASAATFRLTDERKIVDEKTTEMFPGPLSSEEIETISRNRKYLDAVKVLIETDMLDAAGHLLERVEGPSPQGRKEVMTGYLLARKGDCPEAWNAFAKARVKSRDICIPAEYYNGCSAE